MKKWLASEGHMTHISGWIYVLYDIDSELACVTIDHHVQLF